MDYDKKWDNRLTFTAWEVACLIHHIDPDNATASYLAVNMPKQFNKINLSRKELISHISSDCNNDGDMISRELISAWFDSRDEPCPEVFKTHIKSESHAVPESKLCKPEISNKTKQVSCNDVVIEIKEYGNDLSVTVGDKKRDDLNEMVKLTGRVGDMEKLLRLLAHGTITKSNYIREFKKKDKIQHVKKVNKRLRDVLNLSPNLKPIQQVSNDIVSNIHIELKKDKDLSDTHYGTYNCSDENEANIFQDSLDKDQYYK